MSKEVLNKVAKEKARRAPKEPSTEEKTLKAIEGLAQAIIRQKQPEVIIQPAPTPQVNVEVDTEALGREVGKQLQNMPAPVVNVPPREARSYQFTVRRDGRGNLNGELHPISGDA